MAESNNPFAQPADRRRSGFPGLVVLACFAAAGVALVLILLFSSRERSRFAAELKSASEQLRDQSAALARAQTRLEENEELISSLTNQIAELEREKDDMGRRARSLEDEMREQLESKDVTISRLQGKLTVTIVDRVMFDSGEAVLKPDGAAVMNKIADLLKAHPALKIHVIGHTDNVPIRASAQSRFASNWELSTARALAAVRYLTEKAGVDPRRLGAVGYGEFRPIADNATSEGRARNRRIAITILPDELADPEIRPNVPNSQAPSAGVSDDSQEQ